MVDMKNILAILVIAIGITMMVSAVSNAAPDAQPSDAAAVDAAAPPSGGGSVEGPTEGPTTGPVGQVQGIWGAFKGGKYREAIGGIIALLVFLWRRYLGKLIIGKLSSWWVGFVTVLLGFLGSIPEALAADPFSWVTFVWSGLLTSASAMLVWQMAGKKLLPKVFGETPVAGG